jgi:hypothetical protein
MSATATWDLRWAAFGPYQSRSSCSPLHLHLRVRIQGESCPGAETTLAYVIWLISGYGPWIANTEAIMGAANSVVGASGLVKNMAFKTELLPIAGALTTLGFVCKLSFFLEKASWRGGLRRN